MKQPPQVPAPRAAVTCLAANTSMGDAVTACAAARARLSRPAPLDREAFDEDEGAKPIVGHPVPTVTGFQGDARLLALALPALVELVRSAALEPGEEVGLFLAVPDLAGRARLAGAPVPPALGLLDRLVCLAGVTAAPALRQAFPHGHVGFALAVQAAMQRLAMGRERACIVGGVDTLCDDLAVDALAAQGRLKTGDNPVGLQPGEGAVLLLLEPPSGARRRKAPVLAVVEGVGVAREPRTGDDPPVGEGLAAAVRQLVESSGPPPSQETFFVLDRNGEATRANDWGYCQRRLAARMRGLLPATQWDPATAFGDTGAASGALAAQMAARSYARGYAPQRCALILSSSDGGGRSAIRLEGAS